MDLAHHKIENARRCIKIDTPKSFSDDLTVAELYIDHRATRSDCMKAYHHALNEVERRVMNECKEKSILHAEYRNEIDFCVFDAVATALVSRKD